MMLQRRLRSSCGAGSASQLERSLRWSIIHQNLFFGDQLLHPRTADVESSDKKLVKPFGGIVGRNRNKNWKCFRHSEGSILQAHPEIAHLPNRKLNGKLVGLIMPDLA